MAIIIRIISADGTKTVSKKLPALPAHLKIPAGAKVEIVDTDTDEKMSLPQYVNARSSEAGEDGEGSDGYSGVRVETVQDWGQAVAWLDSVGGQDMPAPEGEDSDAAYSRWYDTGSTDDEGSVLGFDKDTLLIGGLVGAGIAGGAFLLSDDDGPKDDVPPVAPTNLNLADADDTGSSPTDNVTSKTSELTVTGTAEAGSTVELFDREESLGTVTAGADGAFTFELDLEEGVHVLTAIATDAAGNASGSSGALPINIDTTAPGAASALDLQAADDTGVSNTDNITNSTEALTITGTAPAGATVELFAGNLSLGTVTAASNGTFSMDINFTEGTYNVTAKTTDAAGNEGEVSDPITITVDRSAPLTPRGLGLDASDDDGESSSDDVTSITEDLTFHGLADPGSRIELVEGTTVLGTGTADANGIFLIDIDLDPGVHQLFARATDLAGNTSPSSVVREVTITSASTVPEASESLLNSINSDQPGNMIG